MSTPVPGVDVQVGDQVRELPVPLGSQPRDRLLLRRPGRKQLADDPFEEDVGRVPEDLRARDDEADGGHPHREREQELRPLGGEPGEQPPQRAAEVLAPPGGRPGPEAASAGRPHHAAAASSPSCETTISR